MASKEWEERQHFKKGISQYLKEAREAQGISASDLARLVGVTPTAVWNWEKNGIKPRPDALAQIARALGVTAEFLLTGQNTTKAPRPLEMAKVESVASILEDARARLARSTGLTLDRIKLQVHFATE